MSTLSLYVGEEILDSPRCHHPNIYYVAFSMLSTPWKLDVFAFCLSASGVHVQNIALRMRCTGRAPAKTWEGGTRTPAQAARTL